MAEKKSFLLRLPPELLEDLNRWAADELRSLNGQIEYLLRDAVRKRGRERKRTEPEAKEPEEDGGRL
ncbi:MAG: Arc family DNA-binding protein [Candidatus Hydrogenedentes bacterium]|nr:Arc family DNA-binding protein [Candidatus Hydrogenedentota bacterium]